MLRFEGGFHSCSDVERYVFRGVFLEGQVRGTKIRIDLF